MERMPLKQIRLSDQVAEHVRNYIANARLQPGDPLPSETELARELGVGRPTVREAMNALAGMGLVRVASGKSPTVGSATGHPLNQIVEHAMAVRQVSLRETLEFRRFVEERSVALTAVQRSEQDVIALAAVLAEMRLALGDLDRFSLADIAFHKILARASGNALVRIIIDGISEAALASSRGGLQLIASPQEWQATIEVHEGIYRAVEDKDPERATVAMRAHFDNALQRVSCGHSD